MLKRQTNMKIKTILIGLLYLFANISFAQIATLINFHGTQNGTQIKLTWQTTQETNSNHFTIWRSVDKINFSNVGTVASVHNSTSTNNYIFNNTCCFTDTCFFYNIEVVAMNGATAYFDTIKVCYSSLNSISEFNSDTKVNIFPNPVSDQLTIDCGNMGDITSLNIYSSVGKLLYSKNITNDKAIIDCKQFESGLYIIKLLDKSGHIKVTKFIAGQ
ncbi:MAG: T9SS type A sorting domain-containing protein [Bacteroidia bacterium]